MEVPEAHGHEIHIFIAELFGTAWLTFAVLMQASFTDFGVFGIAMTLFGCILLWGPITGGNFNPAVTLGVLVSRPHDLVKNLCLFFTSTIAQFCGALLGMLCAWGCIWKYYDWTQHASIAQLKPTTTDAAAFISEIVLTFFFIIIILMVKNPITAPSKEGYLCCWTVGVQLLCCITLAAGHTGAALNPAVGVAVLIYDAWRQSEYTEAEMAAWTPAATKINFMSKMWIYTLGPYLGGLIAGIFHHYHVWSTQAVLHEQLEVAHAIVYHDDAKQREQA